MKQKEIKWIAVIKVSDRLISKPHGYSWLLQNYDTVVRMGCNKLNKADIGQKLVYNWKLVFLGEQDLAGGKIN